MRVLKFFIISLCLVGISLAEENDGRKIKVGLIAPLSGTAQSFGESAKNGILMALEDIKPSEKITVMYEDDAYTPAKTVTAFNKLVEIDKVDVVISTASTPSNAVAPIAEQRKIPLIAWASDQNVSRNRKYVIRSYPSGEDEGRVAASESLKRGVKKLAIFISQNDYALSWKLGVEKLYTKDGLVANETVMDESTDYRSLALKAKTKGAEGYAICLDPGKSGIIARQVKEIHKQAVIFGCENLHSIEENKISNGALTGAWFATISIEDSFYKRTRERFGANNVISATANMYDTIVLLNRLDLNNKKAGIINGIMKQEGISGAVGKFKVVEVDGDQYFDIPLVIKEVTSDGFITIK